VLRLGEVLGVCRLWGDGGPLLRRWGVLNTDLNMRAHFGEREGRWRLGSEVEVTPRKMGVRRLLKTLGEFIRIGPSGCGYACP
jgi:hypothetical protein